ncbi:MAG TPA: YlxR family protein [Ktedonobacterales bacterium]|nr:YlxR family protein [Ktedonobacterales bacterium]
MANTPKKRKGPKVRRVPQRTCIVCRQVRPKRELIRVVRTPDGHVELDATGKKSGRGAYLCARRSCWEPALHKGRLEREFELTLLPEDRAALEAYLESLPPETAAPVESATGTSTGKPSRGKRAQAPQPTAAEPTTRAAPAPGHDAKATGAQSTDARS